MCRLLRIQGAHVNILIGDWLAMVVTSPDAVDNVLSPTRLCVIESCQPSHIHHAPIWVGYKAIVLLATPVTLGIGVFFISYILFV